MERLGSLSFVILIFLTFISLCIETGEVEQHEGLVIFLNNKSTTDINVRISKANIPHNFTGWEDTFHIDFGETATLNFISEMKGDKQYNVSDDKGNVQYLSFYFKGGTMLVDINFYDVEITWGIRD